MNVCNSVLHECLKKALFAWVLPEIHETQTKCVNLGISATPLFEQINVNNPTVFTFKLMARTVRLSLCAVNYLDVRGCAAKSIRAIQTSKNVISCNDATNRTEMNCLCHIQFCHKIFYTDWIRLISKNFSNSESWGLINYSIFSRIVQHLKVNNDSNWWRKLTLWVSFEVTGLIIMLVFHVMQTLMYILFYGRRIPTEFFVPCRREKNIKKTLLRMMISLHNRLVVHIAGRWCTT